MIRRKLAQHKFLGKRRYYEWMHIIKKKHKQMARRLGRQIGDRRDNFSRQSFFLLAMATKTVAAWSADCKLPSVSYCSIFVKTKWCNMQVLISVGC